MNEIRRVLCCQRGKAMQDLPLTQSVLVVEHTRRASYKASVWSTCHLPQDDLPSPEGWGWTQDNGSWQPLWTASKVCSELVKCGGKTKDGCTTRRCACNKAQWNCKALCKCACSKWTLRHSAEELSWRCIHICYFFVFLFCFFWLWNKSVLFLFDTNHCFVLSYHE